MRYLFDSSLEGLLTAVFVGYREIEESEFVSEDDQASFLQDEVRVKTQPEKAKRVKDGVIKTFGWDLYHYITLAFRADDLEKDTVIARVIKGAYVHGKLYLQSAEEEVVYFTRLARNVQREVHAYKGLLRFQEIRGGYLLAEMEPQSDILDLITNHFKARMPQEQFIILDQGRQKMSLYNDGVALYHDIGEFEFDRETQNEFIEQCWVEFYRAVKIDERENLKGMQNNMPKRFWKYLPERQKF